MIFRQHASVAVCVQSLMLAQKCRPRISEFWPKFTFLLEQQIKFVLMPNEIADKNRQCLDQYFHLVFHWQQDFIKETLHHLPTKTLQLNVLESTSRCMQLANIQMYYW